LSPPPSSFPSSFVQVCRLKRSLCGLKQALRAWFEKFHTTFLDFTFTHSQYDSSLFFRKTALGIVILLVYVDDIVKDLGPLQYFLGLEVQHCPNDTLLHQHKYPQ
jgi:hypothetical protein